MDGYIFLLMPSWDISIESHAAIGIEIIVIIVAAYLICKLIKDEKILAPNRPGRRSAEDILAERYAKGEILEKGTDFLTYDEILTERRWTSEAAQITKNPFIAKCGDQPMACQAHFKLHVYSIMHS